MTISSRHSHWFPVRIAAILLGITTCAVPASAQAPKTDYSLNTPYVCPDGTSYTFTQRTGTGYFSTCYYTVEKNGRLVTKAISACRQMAGYLRGCKLQNKASSPASVPVEDWHSRPTNPAYLSAMPYVEQVKNTIQGTSPDDTLARQVTVFTGLAEMIQRMREAGRPYGSPWTPDETRITYAYNVAAKQISDAYAGSHSPQQTNQISHLEGHYQLMDDQFYRQWTSALLPADFLNAYNHAAWGMLAQYQAHVEQEKKQNEEAVERAKAAQQAAEQGTPGLPNDAGRVALRRCLDLGGSELQCLGKGLSSSFFDLTGIKPVGTTYSGLTLTGVYKSAHGIEVGFMDTKVNIGNCGKLIIDARNYTLRRDGKHIAINVANRPSVFSFQLQPDGQLVGPPSAAFDGKVITGYHHYYTYKYNIRTGEEIPGTRQLVTEPIYAPLTRTCAIGTLSPAGPMVSTLGVLADITKIVGLSSGLAPANSNTEMPPPGIRMFGPYTNSGGLKAEFEAASVVLDCGEAHVRDKYTVEREGNQILVHVQNPASPFTATLQPDGSLSGPATVNIAGRILTGMTGDKINYTPRNAACSAGRLYPNGAAAPASSGSANIASQPVERLPVAQAPLLGSAANATLSVASAFPAGADPLAGKWIFLMDETMDNVVRDAGIHPPAGITACEAWVAVGAACRPATKCAPLMAAIDKHTPERFMMPANGRGAFPSGVHAGTYYVMTIARVNNAAECWNVRVDLKPGANSLALNARNAESIR